MSEEVMAVPATGPAAAPKQMTEFGSTLGSRTRAMRDQARRRRDAEAKLQLHLLQARNRPAR